MTELRVPFQVESIDFLPYLLERLLVLKWDSLPTFVELVFVASMEPRKT